MADSKITALASISTSTDPAVDPLVIVDVSDTSMAATGTTKKVTLNNLLSSSPTATGALTVTGLVTAGSASITGAATVGTTLGVTGNLTVQTNKLFVNATGVGIGNAGPLSALTVSSQTDARLSVRTTEAVFGSITGGTALDSLNDSALALVPFGCRGSTVSFGTVGQTVGLQLDASNNVNVPLGNVVMGTSGKGIDFSATANSSGTMTSELLNDYEEGTWVGTMTGSITNPTVPVTATGRYTKIGRVVTVQIFYSNVSTVGASGNISITGLPFANSTLQSVGAVSLYQIGTFTGSTFSIIDTSNSSIEIISNISGSVYGNVTHNAGIARYMTTSITYTVA